VFCSFVGVILEVPKIKRVVVLTYSDNIYKYSSDNLLPMARLPVPSLKRVLKQSMDTSS
jgi:hypothetical protein